jgi:outer membrane lipoprotein-sorting protein
MTDQNSQPPDVLDRALAALRDAPVPEGPLPQLVASTVEALQTMAGPQTVRINERKQLMFRILRYSGVAAAAVFIAAVAGWLFLMDRTAAPAFADVIQNVKNARSVSFVTEMPTIIEGSKRGVLRQKFYIQGDLYRMELPSAQEGVQVAADAPVNFMVLIADAKQKKVLQLDYTKKTAKTITPDEKMWQDMAKSLADPIKQLRQLKEKDAEKIGEEELDGVKTQVYRLHRTDVFMGMTVTKDETVKLWVDAKTGLPVRLAVGDPQDKDKQFFVFKDFRWNEALDAELFKLEVPKGFTVTDK